MARKKENIEYVTLPSRDKWMVTFSDMVTLLMTFFVLLISMSSMDAKSLKEISGFFDGATGLLEPGQMQPVTEAPRAVDDISPKVFHDSLSLSRSLEKTLEKEGLDVSAGLPEGVVNVKKTDRGLVMTVEGDILFEERSFELKKEALPVLQGIATSIRNLDATTSIEGHTDDHGTSAERSLLSLRRAGSVLDFFIYSAGLSPTRLCVGGYGSTRPVASNETLLGRKQNRRLEIIILKDQV